jgi:uncharacterized membrane protein YhaH (DUF805 family)
MILVNAWKNTVLENYVNFSGRANRAQYWWFVLANFIAVAVLALLMQVAGIFTLLYVVYAVGVFLPGLALAIRRLHDTNHSGWWILIALIPLAGFIVLLVFYVTAGTAGDNDHGAPSNWPAAAAG